MSARTPDLGRIGIWAGDFDRLSAPGVRKAAAVIEDLGYGTLWFPEITGREAMAQAAMLLSATRHITVAAGMTDIYARDPVTAAAGQRTLEEAFPGRFLLGLWDSHPSLAEDIRGHRFGPPLATMRSYLDALDTAPFGPPDTAASPHRVLAALDHGMLALAAERARGATVLGMPIEYTRTARTVLGDDGLLAVTQLCVLTHDRADTADLARTTAAAALPNRRELLRGLGHENPDALDDRLVDALVAHGRAEDIAQRVQEHFDAGADHVSLHLMTTTPDPPSVRQWEQLAMHLPV
ncbi:TIGR03620 family F420-dependent LLM class oxidoreductase [Streptomyces netropsis]|uniref:Putative F420-dependent oxidoreductase n=1 Tax=Streptomyces netropsis TaxID=55404 RepID=A0A7W7LC57_STRNE|nr:TIGR03620 family F420-dependent LLM class oxidoreductase [Streptomyces netropsis]MBB4887455.1 putative F420-dependent oxidoreductase [Streptomyces netropsis]GGR10439.1 LLM class F420-dependent oxidoreductase [Streptomyces netropsis]